MGCYGYPRGTTPNIDKLSKEGILLESHFSHAPTTSASHMTIFTSVYPSIHNIKNWDDANGVEGTKTLSPQIKTFAEILDKSGFNTVSYNGGGNISSILGFGRGFKKYRENSETEVLDWLFVKPEEPFFLFYHTYQPHDPYNPFSPLDKLFDPDYKGDIISNPESMIRKLPEGTDEFHLVRETFWSSLNKDNLNREIYHIKSLYDSEIFITDLFLNKLFKRLKELDLYDRTIIIFLSDHGEEFFEHKSFLHERLYREILHVPCIVKHPDYRQSIISKVTRNIDIMPTILDLFKLSPPDYIQGKSMVNLLKGGKYKTPPIFSESQDKRESKALQLMDNYKMIVNLNYSSLIELPKFEDLEPIELYELENDMLETKNIFEGKKDEKQIKILSRKLQKFIQDNNERSNFTRGEKVKYDSETEEKLRSLGYIN